MLHEDDALLVVNKPAGLVMHPAPGNWTGTLLNALVHHVGQRTGAAPSEIGGGRRARPGLVLGNTNDFIIAQAFHLQPGRIHQQAAVWKRRAGSLEM